MVARAVVVHNHSMTFMKRLAGAVCMTPSLEGGCDGPAFRRSKWGALRRRELLAGAGAAIAGTAVAAERADAFPPAETGGPYISGTVERIDGDRSLWIRVRERTVAVDLVPGTQPRKEGPVPLTAFNPDEEVVARGSWIGDRFLATDVEPLYRLAQGTVEGREGEAVTTSAGTLRVVPVPEPPDPGHAPPSERGHVLGRRVAPRRPDELSKGDRVIAMGRRDPTWIVR